MSYIETERLILRTWMPGDAPEWHAIASKPDVARYLVTKTPTLETIAAWIGKQIEEQDREGFSCWPVVRKENGRLIGRCGLHRMPEGYVEIAWIFDSEVWGVGYAREAAGAVLRFSLQTLGLHDVYALIDPNNAPSIAVANALHMRFDRVVRAYRRDMLRYVAHG